MGYFEEKHEENQSMKQDLIMISERLSDDEPEKHALWLNEEEFKTVYMFLERFIVRFKMNACRILFKFRKLDDEMGKEEFDRLLGEFGKTAMTNLRKSDLIMQPKHNEFLLLLPGLEEEKADEVIRRILKSYAEVDVSDQLSITVFFENLEPSE